MTVVVDYKHPAKKTRKSVDWAMVSPERVEGIKEIDYHLTKVDDTIEAERASGEWIGLLGLNEHGIDVLLATIAELEGKGVAIASWTLPQLLSHIAETGKATIAVQYIHDNWLDVDDLKDLSDLYRF